MAALMILGNCYAEGTFHSLDCLTRESNLPCTQFVVYGALIQVVRHVIKNINSEPPTHDQLQVMLTSGGGFHLISSLCKTMVAIRLDGLPHFCARWKTIIGRQFQGKKWEKTLAHTYTLSQNTVSNSHSLFTHQISPHKN